MKKIQTVLLIILVVACVLSVPVAYSTWHGYTGWFWRNFKAVVLVDGTSAGYVHNGKRLSYVTRTDLKPRHSYLVLIVDSNNARVVDCGQWVAPSWIVFPIGHTNPPCFVFEDDDAYKAVVSPASRAILKNGMVEFTTKEGKLIQVRLR